MTIRQQGGVFGRNPSFNDVTAETLDVSGSASTGPISVDGSVSANIQASGIALSLSRLGVDGLSAYVAGTGASIFSNTRCGLFFSGSDILPASGTGGATAAGVDLGSSSFKFRDINISGNVIVDSGQGIDFSATSGTGTSELFDDYEEGEVSLSTTAADVDITGNYIKCGRMVTVMIAINPSSPDTTWATGDTITGLPFAAATASSPAGGSYSGGQYYGGYMMTATTMRGRFYVSGTSITIIDGFGTSTNYSASFTYISET